MKRFISVKALVTVTGLMIAAIVYGDMNRLQVKGSEFDKKLSRDTTEIADAAHSTSSYSEVVQRILPSVVSVEIYSKKGTNAFGLDVRPDDLDSLPPQFRDFFEEWYNRRGSGPKDQHRHPMPEKPLRSGLGSGVIITADGYILTNNHVVNEADEIKVEIPGKGKKITAKVIGTDPQTDVALIKVEAEGLPIATLGDSTKLRVGDVVLAVGSPMGLQQSVTHGIVSGLGRSELGILGNARSAQASYENFIQTDAAINPGNSGGPLLDTQGRVMGLNAAIETRSGMFAGIGLAIPINMVVSVARDLLDGGKVQRGFLGIEMDQIDTSMADYLGLEHGAGVIVNAVVPGSPAAKAGFQEGDAIIRIDDQKVTSPSQLRLIVSAHHPGEDAKFEVVRYDNKSNRPEHHELVATLKPLPDKLGEKTEKKTQDAARVLRSGESFINGVVIETLDEKLRRDYNVTDSLEGVVVTSVDKDTAAATVLEEGDVIIQVNHKPVKNTVEAIANKGDAGAILPLKINRNGRTKYIVVKN